jgi:predicted nucleic-acid-binding protein
MNVTADTNILVRAVVRDDEDQALIASRILKDATVLAVSSACLCEMAWVLRTVYRLGKREIADAIQALLNAANVEMDVPAVEAGLDVHEAGGDFADGVIGYEGRALGGDIFVSFDQDAVKLMARQGFQAELAGAVRR